MDIKTIDHLCELSKLNYSDTGKEVVMNEMSHIIDLMDTVKEIDVIYDDTKDNNQIGFDDLREDVSEESFKTEKLLQNTEPRDNCYVVPKMME